MSDRPIDINLSGSASNKINFDDLTPEQKKARLVNVLERGVTGARLQVDVPPGVYGEWVPFDEESIMRMESMGFVEDRQYATARSLHSDGTGRAKVADVIFMTCSQETKDMIDAIKREQFDRVHGKPGAKRGQIEDRELDANIRGTGMPVINSSQTNVVNEFDIANAVKT